MYLAGKGSQKIRTSTIFVLSMGIFLLLHVPDAVRSHTECGNVKGDNRASGQRQIEVQGRRITVWCDQDTDGGGWMVILRRMDGSADFNRTISGYLNFFGNINGEFWLGLYNMAALTCTSSKAHVLRVDLEDTEGNKVFAVYDSVSVCGDQFVLSVGNYSGTAGDSLITLDKGDSSWLNPTAFSARRKPGATGQKVCGDFTFSGWWFSSCYLYNSNLNGFYRPAPYMGFRGWHGIYWYTWQAALKDQNRTYSRAEMKIRPRDYPAGSH